MRAHRNDVYRARRSRGKVWPVLLWILAGLIVLAVSYLVEDRGRRVRSAWARVRGKKLAEPAAASPQDPSA